MSENLTGRTDPETEEAVDPGVPRQTTSGGGDHDEAARPVPTEDVGQGGETPTFRMRTDLGNAERLADAADGKLLWVYGIGWLYWDGKRWKHDESNRVVQEATNTVRSIYREAATFNRKASKATDEDERKELAKDASKMTEWARKSEAASHIDAIVRLGRAQKRLVLDEGAAGLDANPNALNVADGILDLDTCKRRDPDPSERHTKLAAAGYGEGDAHSELWEEFLRKILPSDDVRLYVQKAAGSSLRGRYSEDLFIPWGSGKNGKSTFLRVIRHALGDYAMEAAPELLIQKRGNRNAGDLSAIADLRGRRLVTTIETGQGKRLDEQLVKQLTGESVMKAKFMRQDHFEFENQTTVWLATNHKPQVQGADVAIWERLHLIPFTVYIPPEERDRALGAKLEQPEHQAAILVWLVEGLRLFEAEGLTPPTEVVEATEEYREEMDLLHNWIESRCEMDPKAVAPVAWVQNSYAGYCHETKTAQLPAQEFNELLVSRGLTKGQARVAGKVRKVWKGVRLSEEWMFSTTELLLGKSSGNGD